MSKDNLFINNWQREFERVTEWGDKWTWTQDALWIEGDILLSDQEPLSYYGWVHIRVSTELNDTAKIDAVKFVHLAIQNKVLRNSLEKQLKGQGATRTIVFAFEVDVERNWKGSFPYAKRIECDRLLELITAAERIEEKLAAYAVGKK